MTTISFSKYQGAGNDFILIDDRNQTFNRSDEELVKFLCDRRFGIGADGLMLLRNHAEFDFEMIYYNSDGREGSMCGNGGRCIVAFASKLQLIQSKTRFMAVDGLHEALVIIPHLINLKMSDVSDIEKGSDYCYLNTGSPHYVSFVNNVNEIDVFQQGKSIRNNERFSSVGTNVNFLEIQSDELLVRTYERGVEDETWACGTGVVASAISAHAKGDVREVYPVKVLGGNLEVTFNYISGTYQDIWLKGPATFVFFGQIQIPIK